MAKVAQTTEKTDTKVAHTKQVEKIEGTEKIKPTYYEGIGRRKVATSRVRLYVVGEGSLVIRGKSIAKGEMMVNGIDGEKYFPGEVMKKMYSEPFRTTNTIGRFAVSVTTSGGGIQGQLSSFILAVSRALEKVDKEKFRPILKKRGFMTRDPRAKQRRKAGYAGKSRARKQSPKR
jgi:small subunit ribosomal protein S9